jgi:hypothetical protein
MSLSWRSGPLGVAVEEAYGKPAPGVGCLRGLVNWSRLCNAALGDAPPVVIDSLEQNLRESQAKSFKFLWEWWNSQYHDPSLMPAVEEHLRTTVQYQIGACKPRNLYIS